MSTHPLHDLVGGLVRDVPDFPKPGVVFKDITPLLDDAAGFAAVVKGLAEAGAGVDKVIGLESRGFIFGAPVALELGVGFVPVRKPGKLPRETHAVQYELEYGHETLEIHTDALAPGERVLIVDDVLATGGTAAAAAELIRNCGAEPVALAVVLELGFLSGRDKTGTLPVTSLHLV